MQSGPYHTIYRLCCPVVTMDGTMRPHGSIARPLDMTVGERNIFRTHTNYNIYIIIIRHMQQDTPHQTNVNFKKYVSSGGIEPTTCFQQLSALSFARPTSELNFKYFDPLSYYTFLVNCTHSTGARSLS
jgi:hypothetical protein